MKFSENWLREFVDPPVGTEELAEQLTMAGLEVEAVIPCRPAFSGVVAARVVHLAAHPDADNLRLCRVDSGGGQEVDVVCGAGNVRAGGVYPLARPGARLPDGRHIQAVAVRGVRSEGMLCSAAELGLSDDAAGLLELETASVAGRDVAECLELDDHAIELSLTPNRGDCLCLTGIAREVAVLNGSRFSPRGARPVAAVAADRREIELEAEAACPRYAGRIIRDVDAARPTPLWLRERLRRSDIRSVNVVVDITNYVMLELGQPMHAFDSDTLEGDIRVRFAREKERLTLLDGSEQTLAADTLVIADAGGAVAMAGVMGGQHSAVGEGTRNLFLESAWFEPGVIMGRARRYGLHTDASHRFERGVDPTLQVLAVERATSLILSICGGRPGPVVDELRQDRLPAPREVSLRAAEVSRRLGTPVEPARCWKILRALGFSVSGRGAVRPVRVPPYRFDVTLEADLIEEIARIHGYRNIPSELPRARLHMPAGSGGLASLRPLLAALTERGYFEAITYSFVDPEYQRQLLGVEQAAALLNPISADLAVMRRSLWPGLLQALQYNLKRQQQRIRLFERGRVYRETGEYPVLAGLIYGNRFQEQWAIESNYSDFYDMKGDVENLLRLVAGPRAAVDFKPVQHPALHAGQAAAVMVNNEEIGCLGALHPRHLRALDIPRPTYLFELEMSRIPSKKQVKYTNLSKYPSVRRDLSVLVDETIAVGALLQHMKSLAGDYLINLQLFDLYRGEGIDLGKKSLTLGLTFQRSSSTLTDEEVDSLMALILNSLKEKFGATLRE